tara:strand:+ start:257 stop:1006 length:750 start_codon:yes stop_codon:yes gene_type:complete
MTDVKVPSSGNIRVWWGTTSAFADYKNPTAAEINACLDISEAVSWNDFDFNLEASNQLEDPAITALGKTFDRGYANWGGSISFYYPKTFGDASSKYSLVYDTLDAPRTAGFVVMRADGAESTALAADGDFVHVLAVKTDGYAESVAGEEAFRYTVTMLPQGTYAARTCVGGGTPVVTPATLSSAAGDHDQLAVTWGGRVYTNGVTYTSSDATKATVSTGGVVTSVATGSAVITATSPDAGVATCTVTVS